MYDAVSSNSTILDSGLEPVQTILREGCEQFGVESKKQINLTGPCDKDDITQ